MGVGLGKLRERGEQERRPAEPERRPFGWQGVTAMVPANWTLGGIGGDHRSGYFRLDDEEMPRLEVKWSEGTADLNSTLAKYSRQLLRRARRGGVALEFQRDTRLIGRRTKPDKRLICFAVETEPKAQGMVWVCRSCGRTLVAQVLGRPEERVEGLARQIFTSLEDHAQRGDECWALFDFVCQVPQEYRLEGHKLLAGYLELDFRQGRRRLRFRRWGLAQRVLEERSVLHWAEVENVKRRDVSWEASACQLRGHAGAELRGRAKGLGPVLRRAARGAVGLAPGDEFRLLAWHCPEANRLYAVEGMYQPDPGQLEALVGGVVCHG